VGAERGEVLRHALVVADVAEHDLEDADRAAVTAGDREARAHHERDEAHRLERDGLATGIRAADHHGAARRDRQVAGDHGLEWIGDAGLDHVDQEEGMTRAHEVEPRFVREVGEAEMKIDGEPRRARAHVGAREGGHRAHHTREEIADASRELRVDRDLLALHLGLEHLQAVPHRDDGTRLHEERRAARAGRVHDAREALVRIRANGHDVATLALGDVAILEDPFVLRHQVVEAREHARARGLVLAAELLEARARAVGERAVGVERARQLVGQGVERGVGGAGLEEHRAARAAHREEAPEDARRRERLADLADLRGAEHAGRAHAPQRRRHIAELGHGQRLAGVEQILGLARLVQDATRFAAGRRERQLDRERLAHVGEAAVAKRREQAAPFEVAPRLGRAGIAEVVGGSHGVTRREGGASACL